MAVDASRAPRPLWKRASILLMVAVLIAALAWVIWVKELHHTTPHLQVLSQALVMLAGHPADSSGR